MNYQRLLLGIIPGLGHAHSGHAIKGFFYFFVFISLLNGFIIAPILSPGNPFLRLLLLIGTTAVWALSIIDLFRLLRKKNPSNSADKPDHDPSG